MKNSMLTLIFKLFLVTSGLNSLTGFSFQEMIGMHHLENLPVKTYSKSYSSLASLTIPPSNKPTLIAVYNSNDKTAKNILPYTKPLPASYKQPEAYQKPHLDTLPAKSYAEPTTATYNKPEAYEQPYSEPTPAEPYSQTLPASYNKAIAYEKPYSEPLPAKSYAEPTTATYNKPEAYEQPYSEPTPAKPYSQTLPASYNKAIAYEKPYSEPLPAKPYAEPLPASYKQSVAYSEPPKATFNKPVAYQKPYSEPLPAKPYAEPPTASYNKPVAYDKPYSEPLQDSYNKPIAYEQSNLYNKSLILKTIYDAVTKAIQSKSYQTTTNQPYPESKNKDKYQNKYNLINTCSIGHVEPILSGSHIVETYCRCPSGTYGLTCLENYNNPCISSTGKQPVYYHADNSLSNQYFLECNWHLPYLFKCPKNLVWNQHILSCDYSRSHYKQLATTYNTGSSYPKPYQAAYTNPKPYQAAYANPKPYQAAYKNPKPYQAAYTNSKPYQTAYTNKIQQNQYPQAYHQSMSPAYGNQKLAYNTNYPNNYNY